MYSNTQIKNSLEHSVENTPGLKPFISDRTQFVRQQLTELDGMSSNQIINKIDVPNNFTVSDNYPNPFNPETAIDISLAVPGDIEFTILDLLGQVIEKRILNNLNPGVFRINFHARNLSTGT